MATIEEMARVLYNEGATPLPESRVKDTLRRALQLSEVEGLYYGIACAQTEHILCTVWEVGDYEVTYMSDDEDLGAKDLTDEMMDDLIIEEAA